VIGPPSYLNRMTKNGGLKDDKGDFPPLETQGVKSMLRRSIYLLAIGRSAASVGLACIYAGLQV
jgi:hypothetical protein